jgi:hypothetical protein
MKALVAILAAPIAILAILPNDSAPEVRLISPQHDGHLWLAHPRGKWQPIHHPDCPCRDAVTP